MRDVGMLALIIVAFGVAPSDARLYGDSVPAAGHRRLVNAGPVGRQFAGQI
jgi:hypothetical protein